MNNPEFSRIAPDVKLGRSVTIHGFVNLYGCTVGDETRIGAFVEVTRGATIGARCKISSHTFICGGVTIEDEVFIGHGVMFTNDRYPRATNEDGTPQTEADWTLLETTIKRRASIGSGAVILPGLTVGVGAIVGAGSVVTRDVPDYATVAGNPARIVTGPNTRLEKSGATSNGTVASHAQIAKIIPVAGTLPETEDNLRLVRERSG